MEVLIGVLELKIRINGRSKRENLVCGGIPTCALRAIVELFSGVSWSLKL